MRSPAALATAWRGSEMTIERFDFFYDTDLSKRLSAYRERVADGDYVEYEAHVAALAAKDARIAELISSLAQSEPHARIDTLRREVAAKDAENSRIRHVLRQLLIDCNGKIHADHWNLAMSALEMNDAPPSPHPDSARLDKLPQCFRMLRTDPGIWDGPWWFTHSPSNVYLTLRDALDAHEEPKP